MVEVESFTLDNNKVIAPYVRLISNEYEKRRYRFEFRYSLFTIGDFKRYFEVSIALVIFVSGKKWMRVKIIIIDRDNVIFYEQYIIGIKLCFF